MVGGSSGRTENQNDVLFAFLEETPTLCHATPRHATRQRKKKTKKIKTECTHAGTHWLSTSTCGAKASSNRPSPPTSILPSRARLTVATCGGWTTAHSLQSPNDEIKKSINLKETKYNAQFYNARRAPPSPLKSTRSLGSGSHKAFALSVLWRLNSTPVSLTP